MGVRYLFSSSGDYVAFVTGDNVFDPELTWLGVIRSGNEFYLPDGSFAGILLSDDRIAIQKGRRGSKRIAKPYRPYRPFKPVKPLKRLRMPRLPAPYVDVFEHGIVGGTPNAIAYGSTLDALEGAQLYAADDTYLGKITKNGFDPDSLLNQFGQYGNPYNPQSLFNQFSPYGNPFSQLSPYNQFTRTPPRVVKSGTVLGYLTANQFISPRIAPEAFHAWLGRSR